MSSPASAPIASAVAFKSNYLSGIAFIAALRGYLVGFNFEVTSGALPFLRQKFTLTPWWEGLLMGSLGQGQAIFARWRKYGQQHLTDELKRDYFAVSLPDLLLFEDDLSRRNALHCRHLMGLGYLGCGSCPRLKRRWRQYFFRIATSAGPQGHLQLLSQFISA
jgi:hypothetical protein